jgi:hypothetical protein
MCIATSTSALPTTSGGAKRIVERPHESKRRPVPERELLEGRDVLGRRLVTGRQELGADHEAHAAYVGEDRVRLLQPPELRAKVSLPAFAGFLLSVASQSRERPVHETDFALAHRCGAVPDSHRVPY